MELLVRSNLHHLKEPSHPFGTPSEKSHQTIKNGKQIEIPGSKVDGKPGCLITLHESERSFALDLSERLNIDEIEALVLYKRYQLDESGQLLYAPSGGLSDRPLDASAILSSSLAQPRKIINPIPTDSTLAQLTRYYQAEALALTQLLTTIIFRAAGVSNHDPMDEILSSEQSSAQDSDQTMPIGEKARKLDFMADGILTQLSQDVGVNFVQFLFGAFARAAHQSVNYKYGKEMAKSWAIHYLRVQASLLEALFQLVYWGLAMLDADTTVGLVQGIFGSTFGAQQANIRVIESQNLVEATYWLEKVETLLGLLTLETLGLSGISRGSIVPVDLWEQASSTPKAQLNLVQSKEAIAIIHETIGTASAECVSRKPFALVLLAWSFILSRIHPEALPVNHDQEFNQEDLSLIYQNVASIALAPENGLFRSWYQVLKGRGFWKDQNGEVGDDYVVSYKDTMNCEPLRLRIEKYEELGRLNDSMIYRSDGSHVHDCTTASHSRIFRTRSCLPVIVRRRSSGSCTVRLR